jgi:putative inorganic carbon (hco3(-)) transporter
MRTNPETTYVRPPGRPDVFYEKQKAPNKLKDVLLQFAWPLGIIMLILGGAGISFLIVSKGSSIGLLLIAVMIAIPTVLAVIAIPEFGIIVLLIMAYFIMFLLRLIKGYPLGTIMDGLVYLLFAGFFLKQKYEKNWKIFKGPISAIILIWFSYNILQVGNPWAGSRVAWLYTVRSVGIFTLTYFIFVYNIRRIEFIRIIFTVWMCVSMFAALYATKQEYFGFFDFEQEELNDPLVMLLLFINGQWRKFSIFSDPVAFSYNMVASTLFCFAKLIGPYKRNTRIGYGFMGAFFISAMLYSGTRGAYVLIPAALALYLAMNINKTTLLYGAIGAVFFLALINVPTSNVTLYRFQSAFKPSDDASFNVRKMNQKRIQPYILKHPFGGGLGGSGASGVKYAPGTEIAGFPPDSGYVRVAVEMGSIGLILFCTMMFVVLKEGIKNYFLIQDPELKNYCLAMVLVVFAINFGNYPQEALVQFPTSIYIYLYIALINVTRRLDLEKRGITDKPEKKVLMLRQ